MATFLPAALLGVARCGAALLLGALPGLALAPAAAAQSAVPTHYDTLAVTAAGTGAAPVRPPAALPDSALLSINRAPAFPGGEAALLTFIHERLRYPAVAARNQLEGKVIVSFWVDERGHPYGFGVVEAPHPSLAEEALRAMRLMPDWSPGRREGRPVPLLVHVPVVFRRPANAATKALAPR